MLDKHLNYIESRVAFIGTPARRMESKLFRLFHVLSEYYADSDQLDRERSGFDGLKFDEGSFSYINEAGERLTPRSSRLVLSESEDEEGRRWLSAVLSGPAQEYPYSGGARLVIRMDDQLQQLIAGCREFARVNVHLPKLPGMSGENEAAVRKKLEEEISTEDREALLLVDQMLEEERKARDEQLRIIKEMPVRVAVIDTEMAVRHVIQFSGLLLEQRQPARFAVTQTKNIYLQLPERVHITGDVRNLTHITESLLAKKGLVREYAADREISPLLQKADFICGHAVLNDIEALRADFPQKLKLESCLLIDTQRMADAVFCLNRTASLEECCELAKIPAEENGSFHDALYDARMTAKLFLKLLYPYIKKVGKSPAEPVDFFVRNHGLNHLLPIREFLPDEGES